MPWYCLLALLFLSPFTTKAFNCRNFQGYACNTPDRPFLDGTNTFKTRTPEQISQVLQTNAADLLNNLPAETLPLINDSEPDNFLPHHIWMSTGLSTTPPYTDCFTDTFKLKPNRNDCKQAISRALSSVLKTQILEMNDPTVKVTDRSRLRNEVLYHPAVVQLRQNLSARIENKSITPEMRADLQKKFDLAKQAMAQKVQSLPIEAAAKRAMLSRLGGMTLNTNSCSDDMPALFSVNAYFAYEKNSITYCPSAILKSDSAFFINNLLLHEIAHSLDACNLGLVPEGTALNTFTANPNNQEQLRAQYDSYNTTPELTQCLRSSGSANARICGIDSYDFNFTTGFRAVISSRAGATPQNMEVCNVVDAQDQAKESVSDWFSSELMPALIQQSNPNLSSEQWRTGLANSVELFCRPPSESEGINLAAQDEGLACDGHPADNTRIEGLFLANPNIRSKLSCDGPSNINYCSYGSSPAESRLSRSGTSNTPNSRSNNGSNSGSDNSNSSRVGTGQ